METKSVWASTVNWTQFVGVACAVAAFFGLDVPPEVKAEVITAIGAVQGLITWFLRTFHTKTAIKAK